MCQFYIGMLLKVYLQGEADTSQIFLRETSHFRCFRTIAKIEDLLIAKRRKQKENGSTKQTKSEIASSNDCQYSRAQSIIKKQMLTK
jgi:hypothetical protein